MDTSLTPRIRGGPNNSRLRKPFKSSQISGDSSVAYGSLTLPDLDDVPTTPGLSSCSKYRSASDLKGTWKGKKPDEADILAKRIRALPEASRVKLMAFLVSLETATPTKPPQTKSKSATQAQYTPKRSTSTNLRNSATQKPHIIFETVDTFRIEILSTWGDAHYVGLAGIELFDETGKSVKLNKVSIDANPRDINVLDEYEDDPRVVQNLIDGTLRTNSDYHMWLAPFKQNYINTIDMNVGSIKIGACRIWNYNKNRVSTSRGAREIRILFNGKEKYSGMINKAPGAVTGCVKAATWVFFVCDAKYQDACRNMDKYKKFELEEASTKDKELQSAISRTINSSVSTVQSGAMTAMSMTQKQLLNYCTEDTDLTNTNRPLTSYLAPETKPSKTKPQPQPKQQDINDMPPVPSVENSENNAPQEKKEEHANEAAIVNLNYIDLSTFVEVKNSVTFRILETWGDNFYYGLTGVEFIDNNGNLIPIKFASADPRDLNSIPNNSGDQRTVDKLLTGVNITTVDTNMWLAPTTLQPLRKPQTVSFFFSKPSKLAAIKVYNYNKSFEDSVRGIKCILLYVDNMLLFKNIVMLKKAPGCALFDYSQLIDIYKTPLDERGARTQDGTPLLVPNIINESHHDNILTQHSVNNNPKAYLDPKVMTYLNQMTYTDNAMAPSRIVGFSDTYYAPVEPTGYSFSIIIMSAGNATTKGNSTVCGIDYLCLISPSGKPLALPNGTVIQTNPEMDHNNVWVIDIEKASASVREKIVGLNKCYTAPGTNLGVYTLSFPMPFILGGVVLRSVANSAPFEFMIEMDGLIIFTGTMPTTHKPLFIPLAANRSMLASMSSTILPAPELSQVSFVDVK